MSDPAGFVFVGKRNICPDSATFRKMLMPNNRGSTLHLRSSQFNESNLIDGYWNFLITVILGASTKLFCPVNFCLNRNAKVENSCLAWPLSCRPTIRQDLRCQSIPGSSTPCHCQKIIKFLHILLCKARNALLYAASTVCPLKVKSRSPVAQW